MRDTKYLLKATICVALAFSLISSPAKASVPEASTPLPNEQISKQKIYVLDEKSEKVEVSKDETFYPLPADAENALIVAPDVARDLGINASGALDELESVDVTEKLAKLETASGKAKAAYVPGVQPLADPAWTSYFVPYGTSYNSWKNRNIALIGSATATHYYQFQLIIPQLNQGACGQGEGWKRKYVNGVYQGSVKAVYNLGCGQTFGQTVPWENVSAYPKVRARSTTGIGSDASFR